MQDDAAHELNVEMAHSQRAPHSLASGGEDLGQGLVHGVLQAVVLALAAGLGDLASTLQLGVVALVV